MEYYIWRSCERFGIKPPRMKDTWEELDVDTMASLLAYNFGRIEEDICLK